MCDEVCGMCGSILKHVDAAYAYRCGWLFLRGEVDNHRGVALFSEMRRRLIEVMCETVMLWVQEVGFYMGSIWNLCVPYGATVCYQGAS